MTREYMLAYLCQFEDNPQTIAGFYEMSDDELRELVLIIESATSAQA